MCTARGSPTGSARSDRGGVTLRRCCTPHQLRNKYRVQHPAHSFDGRAFIVGSWVKVEEFEVAKITELHGSTSAPSACINAPPRT